MKKIIASLCLLSSAATVMAGVAPTIVTGKKAPVVAKAGSEFSYLWMPETSRPDVKSRGAESGEVNVSLEFDSEKYYCSYLQVSSATESYSQFVMSNELVFESVIPGEYYVIANFNNLDDPDMPGSCYVIKKITVYGGEITMIKLKPSEATEIVEFPIVLPDGKEPVLPKATPETQYNSSLYDYTGANVDEVAAFVAIANDELGTISMSSGNQTCLVEGTAHGKQYQSIAVSPLDETWHFGAVRWMKTFDDEYYLTCASVNGTSSRPEANGTDFKRWDYDFADNPVCEVFNTPKPEFGFTATPLINGKMDVMGFILYGKMSPKIYLSAPKTNDTEKWKFNYAARLNKVEYDVDIVTSWGSMPDIRSIIAPLVTYDRATDDLVYLASGTSRYGSPLWWNEEGSDPLVYPGNTDFGTSTGLQKYPLGGTAPVAVGVMVAREGEPKELGFTTTYMGLYGEGRCADDALTTAIVTVGDEETVCDMDKFEKEFDRLQADGKLTGAFNLEFLNDRNVVVDGVQGYNNLLVSIPDGSGKDVCPPTYTMLQFRDNNGVIENSFDKGADGVIMVSGGDFNYVDADEAYWLCEAPASMKVEYAAAGSEDFKELPVVEIPENYYMPEYGYYWQGSLKNVEGLTEDGWYQVRLTMTDAAGNSQVQTIYPAFRINANSGIADICDDRAGEDTPVYYNLQGRRVASPSAGVYIRVAGGKADKVMMNR